MIIFLLFLIIAFIVLRSLAIMSLEAVGFLIGLLVLLIVVIIKRRRR